MAVRRLDPEIVRRWVEESCPAQGVPVKAKDREAVERAAALLGGDGALTALPDHPETTVNRDP